MLKEYLVKGYAINEKRLKEQAEKVRELEKSIEVFKRVASNYQLQENWYNLTPLAGLALPEIITIYN